MSKENLVSYDANTQQLSCQGDWDLQHFSSIHHALEKMHWPNEGKLIIDGQSINKLDSAGASLLVHWKNTLKNKGINVELAHFSKDHEALVNFIEKELPKKIQLPKEKKLPRLAAIGKATIQQYQEIKEYFAFIGLLTMDALRLMRQTKTVRWSSLAAVIYRNGYNALIIIALLSLMVGIVIAYQMAVQLRNYGANIYIVDFLGLSVLREFAPLITAIMVAGRTGSSYTAQLGLMKINQEIDALDTMGVTPSDILILPRIAGLFIALPLLTIWADIFGVFGGMIMANNMLSITWYDFLHRFEQVIPTRALIIGLGKAPVFALIISSISCFQGMRVEGSAESVGKNTTKSVVLAIFFIIVVDAFFSVIFNKLKL
ncbi:MAG: MlaE family lipid ABC transporter permease subunit [Gammaproteobacteria bacterium]|nr:MlaE family lipid ABC transporter permease subunit [Gammaproteobacteria bacterium]